MVAASHMTVLSHGSCQERYRRAECGDVCNQADNLRPNTKISAMMLPF